MDCTLIFEKKAEGETGLRNASHAQQVLHSGEELANGSGPLSSKHVDALQSTSFRSTESDTGGSSSELA